MSDDAMFLALFLPELRYEGKSNIVVKLPYFNTSAQGRNIKSHLGNLKSISWVRFPAKIVSGLMGSERSVII